MPQIFTLQNGRESCADIAMGGGLSIDDPRLDREINDACQELILGKSWKLTVFRYNFCVSGGVLRLPWFMETVIQCRINGRSAYPWSMYYEFNPTGPGTCPSFCNWSKDLVDLGMREPLQYPMHKPSRIMVTTDGVEDPGTTITLRGTNRSGLEIFKNGEPGETIPLDRNTPYYTDNVYAAVTATIKGPTKGFVRLQTYDPDEPEGRSVLLSTYHPSEENPVYRLYKVKNSIGNLEIIDALVKLSYYRAKHPTDMLLIQNMPALKLAVQALHKRRNEDFEASANLFLSARNLLSLQLSSYQTGTPEIQNQVGVGMRTGRVQ